MLKLILCASSHHLLDSSMCFGKLFFQRRYLSRISGLALLEIRYSSLQLFLAFLPRLAKLLLKPRLIDDGVLLL